jgi:NAD-dependent DNA ligase
MGVTRADVEAYDLIPADILEYIPEKCPVCGAEVEFTDTLKQIYCTNSRCPSKVAARLESMAKSMKVDGWGESTCLKVCQAFGLVSPYSIFAVGEQGLRCPDVADFDKKMAAISDMSKRKVRLWEVVKLAGIPSIETTAFKIFDGFSSITEAFECIEKYQVPFIADRLGIKNADSSVMAVNVYNTLIEYKEELLFGETQFDVIIPTGETIVIAITGSVDGFRNKSDFVDFLNERYDGVFNIVQVNSVTSKVNILISDGDRASNKYKSACRLKDKGHDIIITDSSEIISILDNIENRA